MWQCRIGHAHALHFRFLAHEMGADSLDDRVKMGGEIGVLDLRGMGEHLFERVMVLVHHGDAKRQLGQVHVILVELENQPGADATGRGHRRDAKPRKAAQPGEGRDMQQDKTPLRRQRPRKSAQRRRATIAA